MTPTRDRVVATSAGQGGEGERLWWLADAITSLRIFLLPVLLVLMARAAARESWSIEGWGGAALAVLFLMTVSDLIDGWIARSLKIASRRGAIIDAIADHLVQVALLVFFAVAGGSAYPRFPWWLLVIYLARDVVLGLGWLVLHRGRRLLRPDHRWHGKLATGLTFILLIAASVGASWHTVRVVAWAAALMVVLSTAGYVRANQAPTSSYR